MDVTKTTRWRGRIELRKVLSVNNKKEANKSYYYHHLLIPCFFLYVLACCILSLGEQ